MSNIVLIRPPAAFSVSCFSSPVSLPVGLAYVAAVLREAGHGVEVIDALGEGIRHFGTAWSPRVLYRGLAIADIVERLPHRPDAIGLSAMFSQEWPHVEDLINAIRAARPHTPIILGGEHATAVAGHLLESCPAATYVVRGEGEEPVVRLLEHIQGRRPIEEVAGVSYRDASGRVIHNAAAARMRSVDHLPWPAWDLFPLEAYFSVGEGHGVEHGRTVTMLATRGCPYQCTFCSSPGMWTTRYVMRSPSDVVDEIEHYIRVYKAENIDFADLTAVVKKGWVIDFCRELQRREVRISWQLPSGTRSEALDAETLDEMAASGCLNLTYAPESGSERTLTAIKKRVKLARMEESMRAAKARGFSLKCNFVIGFPHETRVDVWRTLAAAMRFTWLGVDDIALYPFSPYPGSELFEELSSSGVIPRLDRAYFESLMAIMDLKIGAVYCRAIGPRELSAYQLAGMATCYALGYLRYPSRFLRTWRNYRDRRTDTGFETRVFALVRRWRVLSGARA